MRGATALLALSLFSAAPAAGQGAAPPPAVAVQTPANPYRDLFTRWDGANRDSLAAESEATPSAPESGSIPAYSPLSPRSEDAAVALGRRVGEVVRLGDCAQGERLARAAGDLALVRAVREHCRRPH